METILNNVQLFSHNFSENPVPTFPDCALGVMAASFCVCGEGYLSADVSARGLLDVCNDP
jgi:hypothetical protein